MEEGVPSEQVPTMKHPPDHGELQNISSHPDQVFGLRRCRNVSSAVQWPVPTQVTPPTQTETAEEQIQGPMLALGSPALGSLQGLLLQWGCHELAISNCSLITVGSAYQY